MRLKEEVADIPHTIGTETPSRKQEQHVKKMRVNDQEMSCEETPRKQVDVDLGIWSQSPLVFTSPGGNVKTKGRMSRNDKANTLIVEKKISCKNDENFLSRTSCVTIPGAPLLPPRLRSSFSLITPLKACNRQENNIFPVSPSPVKTKPLPMSASKAVCRPPCSVKKTKHKTDGRITKKTGDNVELNIETLLQQQEKFYVGWINSILNNRAQDIVINPEAKLKEISSEIKQSGRTSLDNASLRDLFSLSVLRQRLSTVFNSSSQDEIIACMMQVGKRIDDGKLRMKDGCAVLADVGLRKHAVDILMCYSASWLKVGLYIVLGESFSNEDSSLEAVLEKDLFTHVGLAREYSTNKTIEGLYRQGYLEALGRVILKRLLLLVLALDRLKSQTVLQDGNGIDSLDGGSAVLFRRDACVKSSRQALQDCLKNAMHGEGDLMSHLSTHGYRLHHVQPLLSEYNFHTTSFRDLQDGVRLCRLAQVLTNDNSLLKKVHLPSNTKKRQKQHCEVALESFARAGVSLEDEEGFMITADCIFKNERDVVLSLIWNILLQLQLPKQLHQETLSNEILRIESINACSKVFPLDLSMSLPDLLLRWTKAICKIYGLEIHSVRDSFVDGQALCYLVSFYLPAFLPHDMIEKEDRSASRNLDLLHRVTDRLGYMEEVLNCCYKIKGNTFWFEKNIILLVGLLFSKLVCTSSQDLQDALLVKEKQDLQKAESSATIIQAHYRGWKQKRIYRIIRRCTESIQSTWRGHIVRKKVLKEKYAASTIQQTWRRWLCRKMAVRSIEQGWLSLLQRRKYSELRAATIVIQAHYRGWYQRRQNSIIRTAVRNIDQVWRTVLQRRKYCQLRAAAIVIQAHYRGWYQRRHYSLTKTAVRSIERGWRSILQRRKYCDLRAAAVVIQAHYRGWYQRRQKSLRKMAVRKIEQVWQSVLERRKFCKLRAAVLVIQPYYKGWYQRRQYSLIKMAVRKVEQVWQTVLERRKLCELRSAALVIQAYFRGSYQRRYYSLIKMAVRRLEQGWQTVLRRKFCRLQAEERIYSVITIQAAWRGYHVRRHYRALRENQTLSLRKSYIAARKIQMAYMSWRERRAYAILMQKAMSVHTLKCARDDNVSTLQYLRAWRSAVQIQTWWRRHIQRRYAVSIQRRIQVSAITIQRLYRAWKTRQFFKRMKYSASLIKAYWKGFITRKEQNEELVELRLRMKNTAATADCNMTLGNRLNEALALLLSFKTVSSILHICETIDYATEHSRHCCERIADGGAIGKIVQLIQTTNRSTPHEQVLKHALSILGNLARYPPLATMILHSPASLDVVAEQLQMLRNKEEIFFRAIEVLKLVCKVSFPQEVIHTSPLVIRRLQHVRHLLERKLEAERKNVEKFAPGVVNMVKNTAEKKYVESKLQLQSVNSLLRLLTGETNGYDLFSASKIQRRTSMRNQRPRVGSLDLTAGMNLIKPRSQKTPSNRL